MSRKKRRCIICGRFRIHQARGRCPACYHFGLHHGWETERPKPRTHCVDCGKPWRVCGRCYAYGRCESCHWAARKAAGLMSLERYCACGEKLRAVIPKEEKGAALAAWQAAHQGATCRAVGRGFVARRRVA